MSHKHTESQRLEMLYRISQIFSSTLGLEDILNIIMDEVIQTTQAERGFMISLGEDDELVFQVARGIDHSQLNEGHSAVSKSIVKQVMDSLEPVLAHEALSDARFKESESVMEMKLRSIICVPLTHQQKVTGVIYVENRRQGGIFSDKEVELLSAIAANASIALENKRLFQDLEGQIRTLNLLYEISADLTSRLELEQLLTATLQRIQSALDAPAASLLTIEGDELVFKVALGEKAAEIKPFRIPIQEGLAGWVVQHGQGVIVNDAQNDPRFYRQADDKSGFLTESLIAAPLLVKEEPIGVIELFNKRGGFTDKDLELLGAIASTASIAIDNARLYQAAVEKGRMERELQMALNVQTGLLPSRTPEISGWEFAASWQPAREVSGDFYDFLEIQNLSGEVGKTLGLFIADVTDKGMPAALFMAYTRSILRASLLADTSPAVGITRANRLICQETSHGLFVTLFYGQLNTATGELVYVNAGHNPPLCYQNASSSLERLMPTGIPLGVVEEFEYQQEQISLAPGDFLFCYTDGIIESINSMNEEFGLERLEKVLRTNQMSTPSRLAQAVDRALLDFTRSDELFDDKTMVVLKRV
jgi:sigma-B regulation protein RsbU (phosphoserine phosphatase)